MKKQSGLRNFATITLHKGWGALPAHIPLMLSLPRPSPLLTFSLQRTTDPNVLRTLIIHPGYETHLTARDFGIRLDSVLNEDVGPATTSRLFDITTIWLFVHDFTDESNFAAALQSLAGKCPNVDRINVDVISAEGLVRIRVYPARSSVL
jgi:hypothetical protein